ncbi:hypothetical protein Avbf_07018 [Armadillidium vulgare]|nr:hypothetical protein Avbf_07018 [Armadillidium vulgare]
MAFISPSHPEFEDLLPLSAGSLSSHLHHLGSKQGFYLDSSHTDLILLCFQVIPRSFSNFITLITFGYNFVIITKDVKQKIQKDSELIKKLTKCNINIGFAN